jgi:hypothetical protein
MNIKCLTLFLVFGFNIHASESSNHSIQKNKSVTFVCTSLDGVIMEGYKSQVNQLTREGWTTFQKATYWLYHEADPKLKADRSKLTVELMKLGADPLVYTNPSQSIPTKGTPLEMFGMAAKPQDLIKMASQIKRNPKQSTIQAELLYGMTKRPEWNRMHRVTLWERIFGAPIEIQELRKAAAAIRNVE